MRTGRMTVALAMILAGFSAAARAGVPESIEALRRSAAAYVEAYNARDYAAVADQWAERAELSEGGGVVAGRDAIVASIRTRLARTPEARIQIRVDDVVVLAEPLARVRGLIQYTEKPGAKPVENRFESLRVLENGVWRLVRSAVEPSHAAALDDLGWLAGNWQAVDAESGTVYEASFERAIGGYGLVGRMKLTPKQGKPIEAFEVIHADRETGAIRSMVLDSTGASAEGLIEADGSTFNRVLAGTPSDSNPARRVEWVQSISPAGDGKFTLHSIERSIDGRPLPDSAPLHFRRK